MLCKDIYQLRRPKNLKYQIFQPLTMVKCKWDQSSTLVLWRSSCQSAVNPFHKQDPYWHFRMMLLSDFIIPIVPASQIFKAVSLLCDLARKIAWFCVTITDLPYRRRCFADSSLRYLTSYRNWIEFGPVQFVFHSIIALTANTTRLMFEFSWNEILYSNVNTLSHHWKRNGFCL